MYDVEWYKDKKHGTGKFTYIAQLKKKNNDVESGKEIFDGEWVMD